MEDRNHVLLDPIEDQVIPMATATSAARLEGLNQWERRRQLRQLLAPIESFVDERRGARRGLSTAMNSPMPVRSSRAALVMTTRT